MFLGYVSEFEEHQLWSPDSRKVIQSWDITSNEIVMFFPRKEYVVPACDQPDDSEKVKLEVPSTPQGGDTIRHPSSEDHTEETNYDSYDIPSSEEQQALDKYSIVRDRH